MNFELWDDKAIVQDNSRNSSSGRVYRWGDREYSSVTNILGHFEDKEFLVKWKQRVGTEEADRIRDTASSHGSCVHGELESYFRLEYPELVLSENPQLHILGAEEQDLAIRQIQENILRGLHKDHEQLIEPFRYLFPFMRPVALEKRLMWHSDDGKLGFGGTADAFKLLDTRLLPPKTKAICSHDGADYALVVLDWKNFNKRKRPIEYNRKGTSYYPLIKYALQLSAYSAAFNKLTNLKYKLNQGVLACAYNVAEEGEPMRYELDLFHFDQRSLCWFWLQFKKIMEAYYFQGDFNWKKFCHQAHAAGVLGEEIGSVYSLDKQINVG